MSARRLFSWPLAIMAGLCTLLALPLAGGVAAYLLFQLDLVPVAAGVVAVSVGLLLQPVYVFARRALRELRRRSAKRAHRRAQVHVRAQWVGTATTWEPAGQHQSEEQ
jgi:hypothetical protein